MQIKKFKIYQTLCLLFFSGAIIASCGKEQVKDVVKESNFTITLPANPTTGFQWTIMGYDESLFQLTKHQYLNSKVRVPGAAGKMLFTFKILEQKSYPKTSIIKFKYSRSWEPNTAVYKEITVHIK